MTRKLNDADLAEIEHLLQTAYCNPLWRKHVSALIAEVVRLQQLLDTADHDPQSRDIDDDFDFANDTVIF